MTYFYQGKFIRKESIPAFSLTPAKNPNAPFVEKQSAFYYVSELANHYLPKHTGICFGVEDVMRSREDIFGWPKFFFEALSFENGRNEIDRIFASADIDITHDQIKNAMDDMVAVHPWMNIYIA